MKSASDFLRDLAQTRNAKVDLAGLAEELTDQFGGVKGLSKAVKEEFKASQEGSMNRGRMLTYVMEIISKASAKQEANDPLAGVDTSDLVRAITSAMKETNG